MSQIKLCCPGSRASGEMDMRCGDERGTETLGQRSMTPC
jgi:hypothetical protein